MELKILSRKEILDKNWNGCVHFAINALPYGYTWFLDNICEEWEGIVLGDYKAVMPLVFNKKIGINYLYQPFFAQQLGVFTSLPVTKVLINKFIDKIPKKYKYIDINLNEINDISEQKDISIRDNYVLDLNLDYALLHSNFSSNLKRNIKKAYKNNLLIQTNLSPEIFVDFYMKHTAGKVKRFAKKHEYSMLRIIYKALSYQMGALVGVADENNNLIAANFILIHPTRIINLLPTSNEEGNRKNAMAFLLNYLIEKNSNQKKLYDFEGSMIEGVARFYKSFGAEKMKYFRFKRNYLPNLLRLIKE